MRNASRAFWRIKVLIALLLIFFAFNFAFSALPVYSQNRLNALQYQGLVGSSLKAQVVLKFTFEDGTWAQATQTEGQAITIKSKEWTLYITPYITDAQNGTIRAVISRMKAAASSSLNNPLPMSETIEINQSQVRYLGFDAPLNIQTVGINKSSKISRETLAIPQMASMQGGTECCITCSGRTMCACAVVTSCGSCCMVGCCV